MSKIITTLAAAVLCFASLASAETQRQPAQYGNSNEVYVCKSTDSDMTYKIDFRSNVIQVFKRIDDGQSQIFSSVDIVDKKSSEIIRNKKLGTREIILFAVDKKTNNPTPVFELEIEQYVRRVDGQPSLAGKIKDIEGKPFVPKMPRGLSREERQAFKDEYDGDENIHCTVSKS